MEKEFSVDENIVVSSEGVLTDHNELPNYMKGISIREFKSLQEAALDRFHEAGIYSYPAKPGTDLWAKLSLGQRKELSEVPEVVLSSLSAEALIKLVQTNPIAVNILAFNTLDEGYANIIENLSVTRALLSRSEASEALLKEYERSVVLPPESLSTPLAESQAFKETLVELSLARPKMMSVIRRNPHAVRLMSERLAHKQENQSRYPSLSLLSSEILTRKTVTENGYLGAGRKGRFSNVADSLLPKKPRYSEGRIKLTYSEYLEWLSDIGKENANQIGGGE